MRKEERPKASNLLELTKDFGAQLGILDDSVPPVGSLAYEKLRVNKLMDEDCISMRNEPIDPLETIEDMQFDMDGEDR